MREHCGFERFRGSLNARRLARLAAKVVLCSGGVLLLAFLVVAGPSPSSAQVSVGISVAYAPPALPVYVQPVCPGPGYIWTPGYWAWDPAFGYYWVPGTWVLAPYTGWLWTPGYWGWSNGVYVWYEGYWGPVVGFYGGINYGFGYNGHGYHGGYWDHGTFYYNRTVNNVRNTTITTVFSRPVPRSATPRRVSFNGGSGGVPLRPTAEQLEAARHRTSEPIALQREHLQAARRDPVLRASANQGRPAIAATPRPGAFSGAGVERAIRAGAPYKSSPTPPGMRERGGGRAGLEERRPVTPPRGEPHAAPVSRGAQERPAYGPGEPRRERPSPRAVHPPAEYRQAPAEYRRAPAPHVASPREAPPAQPRQDAAPRPPREGERREEGAPRP
ncbi:MAG TPA: hypothetical protein VL949_05655 [Geobacteraceae bacterium]|nr:hypothetical protein [Geobacteraceae bacterium]